MRGSGSGFWRRRPRNRAAAALLSASLALLCRPVLYCRPLADVPHLERIRAEAKRNLEKLPDYTCELSIERSRLGRKAREKQSRKKQLGKAADAIALEVAVVDGREHYAWPGDERFEKTDLSSLVGFGMTSTGEFYGHLKSVLVDGQARIEYRGKETLEGRAALRYDYVVGLFLSSYRISTRLGSAKVPYGGSFWVDARSYRVLRLTVRSFDIPEALGVSDALSVIDYEAGGESSEAFLLPARTLVSMDMADGSRNRNESVYSRCRLFQAASEISFEIDENAFFLERRESLPWVDLPPGLTLATRLETAVHTGKDRIGKALEARLQQKKEIDEELTLPKRAVLRGRLRVLRRYTDEGPFSIVGIDFRELQLPGWRARLNLELARVERLSAEARPVSVAAGSIGGAAGHRRIEIETTDIAGIPGVGLLRVYGDPALLPKGLLLVWKTR